jgi:hypothetical protein
VKDGGKETFTCREAVTEAALIRHESDMPDFLQELSKRAYPILIPLTCRLLNVQLTGLAANAASLVFSGSREWQNLIHYARGARDARRIF